MRQVWVAFITIVWGVILTRITLFVKIQFRGGGSEGRQEKPDSETGAAKENHVSVSKVNMCWKDMELTSGLTQGYRWLSKHRYLYSCIQETLARATFCFKSNLACNSIIWRRWKLRCWGNLVDGSSDGKKHCGHLQDPTSFRNILFLCARTGTTTFRRHSSSMQPKLLRTRVPDQILSNTSMGVFFDLYNGAHTVHICSWAKILLENLDSSQSSWQS
jgi:hypothetical protein